MHGHSLCIIVDSCERAATTDPPSLSELHMLAFTDFLKTIEWINQTERRNGMRDTKIQ